MQYYHSLQTSRYELKYLIDEQCARSVRDYARCHLVPDRYAADLPNCEYDVHSLYLDSPDLALCRATRHGERNRFKLRIRFYDDRPDSPAYFEIKRRMDSVIHKRRSAVRRTAVERLLAGQQPRPSDLWSATGSSQFGSLLDFIGLCHCIRATPQVYVSYRREAYVTPDDSSVRVTFDRQIAATTFTGAFDGRRSGEVHILPVDGVVLEVKFTDRFPGWVANMARMLELERLSFAKYVHCVMQLPRTGARLWRMPRPAAREVLS